MKAWAKLRSLSRSLTRRSDVEQEMAEELRFHLEARAEHIATRHGVSHDDAMRQAQLEFGSLEAHKEEGREALGLGWVDAVSGDVRYSVRQLRRYPFFTLSAVLTLALGIGPNATMASLINSVLSPLPVANPGELTVLATTQRGNSRIFQRLAYPDYRDYRTAAGAFADLAAWDLNQVGLTAEGQTDRLTVGIVSGNYFSMLGLNPAAGRLISPGDDTTASPLAVVLGHAYWVRRFGADTSVVGREVRVDRQLATIVGVAPGGFEGTFKLARMDAYLALASMVEPSRLANRDALSVRVLGRLRPDASLREAQAAVDTIAGRLEQQYASTNNGRRVRVFSQRLAATGPQNADQFPILILFLMLLVSGVLLIAGKNVLGLLLARALHRQREMAVRAALGASRWKLVRVCLVEALLIGIVGTVVGGLAGLTLARRLATMASTPGFPIYLNVAVDWRVFAYLTIVMLVSTLVIGLIPALRASRVEPRGGLAEGRTLTPGRNRHRTLGALTVAQIASSVVLLAVCGLFMRSVAGLESADLGFEDDRILLASTDPSAVGYDEAKMRGLYRSADAALEALPDVERVAQSAFAPFSSSNSTPYVAADGNPSPTSLTGILADRHFVSSDYFQTIGTPLLRGRSIADTDREGSPPVAVVNQTMAARLWPGENAIGKRFRETAGTEALVEVVGIVPDARYRRDEMNGAAMPRYFLSIDQFFQGARVFHVRVAGRVTPQTTAAEIQSALRQQDDSVPVYDVFPLAYQVSFGPNGFGGTRSLALVTAVLGATALALALVGLYGMLSFAVGQRTNEIGIRMALGAHPGHVVSMVLRRTWGLTLSGLVLGLGLSLALGQAIRGLLFGVGPYDAATIGGVTFLIGLVSTVVGYLPARRASRIDPVVALRHE